MRLWLFVVRRVILLIPTLLGVTLVTFVLSHAPGPLFAAAAYCNPHLPIPCFSSNWPAQPDQAHEIIQLYHLDEPIPVQYVYYLQDLLRGDWGYTNTLLPGPVTEAIAQFFPPTVLLATSATFVAVIVGIPTGAVSALRKDKLSDHVTRVVALTGYSIPFFWLALILQLFAIEFLPGWPINGQVSPAILSGRPWALLQGTGAAIASSRPTHILLFDAAINGDWFVFWDAMAHLILPTLTLAYGVLGTILRMVRSGMVDSMNQDYVRTAYAKGLPEWVVVRKHIRRNALLPVTTVIGLLFAGLLGGVVLVEDVFVWNGIGRWSTLAVLSGDIGAVMASTLLFAMFLVLINLVVDIIYAYLDPRIRL